MKTLHKAKPLRVVILFLILLKWSISLADPNILTTGSGNLNSENDKGISSGGETGAEISTSSPPPGFQGNVPVETPEELATLSKSATNYASALLGAKIVDFHEAAKGVHQILNDDKDRYMQIPCNKQRKRLTIQLPREIEVNMLGLSNDEFFSSSIKNFTVVGTREYPCRPPECMWRVLGTYQGQQTRDLQLFPVAKQRGVRYVRLLWVSSHGGEKSCTMTRFQAFGVDVLDNLASELTQTIASSADVEEDNKDDEDEIDPVPLDASVLPSINQTDEAADVQVHSFSANGTEIFNGIVLNVSSIDNTAAQLNSTANGTVVAQAQINPIPVKRKKPKLPLPRVNASASHCLESDKEWEKASEEYTRYYEDGPGAICAVPTGERSPKLTASSSKLTAASMQLVLPQQQKAIKGIQANFTKLQSRVEALSDKLLQCKTEMKEVSMKTVDVEKSLLTRIELLEQQVRAHSQAHLASNTENDLYRMDNLRKFSDLKSHTNWWVSILALSLVLISLWVALTICTTPGTSNSERRLRPASSEEELTSTGPRRLGLPRSDGSRSSLGLVGPSPNSLFPKLPQELRGSQHNLDTFRNNQPSGGHESPGTFGNEDDKEVFPAAPSGEPFSGPMKGGQNHDDSEVDT